MKLRYKLGTFLMKVGAYLFFDNQKQKDKLKNAVNANTTLGSQIESGDHLRGQLQPLCEYDTQSVINVLKSAVWDCNLTTHKENYYTEHWK